MFNKIAGLGMVLLGAFLLYIQWGTPEHTMRTAKQFKDLIEVYGPEIGMIHCRMLIWTPVLGIVIGVFAMVADIIIPTSNRLRRTQRR